MESQGRTWLHIGAGSFHRAHQAWYLHRLLAMNPDGWVIALANIRDDAVALFEKLNAQNCRYTLETVDPAGHRQYEEISSIRSLTPWDANLDALIAKGSGRDVGVISFTVTESGYYQDNNARLERANPDLAADLAGAKTTIYGAIAAILQRRMESGGGAVTLLCCDNVRHNGKRFREGLLEFLQLRNAGALGRWVEENTSCPCCMVDRITPRPTPDIAVRVLENTGFADQVPVMSEAFIQWVVEDDFIAGRPELEKAGVEMVADVEPYEEAKIRILNASHACVAWAGTLAGLECIHQDVGDPDILSIARAYITDDVIPCLTPSPLDLAAYRDTVLDRYANPNIRDSNQRVAADGFSKIPAMITPTMAECFARGKRPEATAMLPALFFAYLRRWSEGALPYEYQDGIMDAEKVRRMFAESDPFARYAGDGALFGALAGRDDFVAVLAEAVGKVEAFERKKHG